MSLNQWRIKQLGLSSAAQPARALILMIAVLLMVACMRKAPETPKEGDVVTWRGNQLLIIKAVLGQRRLHTEKGLGYALELEKFIGQFPIDYVPKPFPKLTEKEVMALEDASEKRWREEKHQGGIPLFYIEFNLMLNGSKVIPTDKDPTAGVVDHPDQVKVIITGESLDFYGRGYKNMVISKSFKGDLLDRNYQFELMKSLDSITKVTKAGVDCYENKEGAGRQCFVKSDTPLAADYHFYVPPDDKHNGIQVNRYAAGYTLYWYTDKKNIYRAKEIDAAIWRLLDAWNVSPYQASAMQ